MVVPFAFDRNAVVTIQGGGLHGLTLLGQLAATIKCTEILAIAGCSAGAIIAALVWAGWSPTELKCRIAGEARWKRLHDLPTDRERGETSVEFRDWVRLTREIDSFSSSILGGGVQMSRFGRSLRLANLAYSAYRLYERITPHFKTRGVFSGDQLEAFVDSLLREGLERRGCSDVPSTLLTFRDVQKISERHPNIYFPPLLLAATNVGTQDVELINSLDSKYQGVPIARAVRASAGYPVFFQPIEIQELKHPSWFIDGGVISNFPAWAFSGQFREKMYSNERYRAIAYRPWVHVGLRLIESDVRDEPSEEVLPLFDYKQLERPRQFASALGRLLLGQARNRLEDVISKTLARSVIIGQPIEQSGGPENILDLDAINERRVNSMFASGARFAEQELEKLNFSVRSASAVYELLRSVVARAEALLDPTGQQSALRVRSNIFFPVRRKLRMAFQANMDGDNDIAMEFDSPNQGLTGFCFLFRQPLICNLAEVRKHVENAGTLLFNMTESQQKMVQRDRTWLASMPIFDPNDIIFRRSLLPDVEPVSRCVRNTAWHYARRTAFWCA